LRRELARKRFWSGQLTTAEIIETCKRYQTEQIVLPYAATNSEWNAFLDTGYKAVTSDGRALLYIATHLLSQPGP
jgi:hypothetical protein